MTKCVAGSTSITRDVTRRIYYWISVGGGGKGVGGGDGGGGGVIVV
jgi:hypothetical protein